MSKKIVAKIEKVEGLKQKDVTFSDGTEATRDFLQVETQIDVYDDLLEEFVPEERYFTFWGNTAVKAAKELEKGGYLYIRDINEVELPPTEKYKNTITAYNVKQYAKITKEKAEKVKEKLLALATAKAEASPAAGLPF